MGYLIVIFFTLFFVLMIVFIAYLLSVQNTKRTERMVLKKGDRVRFSHTHTITGEVMENYVDGKVKIEVNIPKHLIYKDV